MPQETNTGSVTVMVVPGRAQAVTTEEGDTVRDVLRRAGVGHEGMQIRVSGEQASLDTEIENGDRVILSRQIKGN